MFNDKLSSITGQPVEISALPLETRYPVRALRREGAKALAGIAICAATLVWLSPAPVIAWPVAAIGLLFLAYLAEQVRRSRLRYRVEATGVAKVSALGTPRLLEWKELESFRIGFYPHRRRALQGTLVLRIQGAGQSMKFDSTLEAFPTLLLHAAAAARDRALTLDPTTDGNLRELGL